MEVNKMGNKKYLVYMIILWFGVAVSSSAYGADEYITSDFIDDSRNITQDKLAAILVNSMGLESELSHAPTFYDYIKILDEHAIRPLGGWTPKKMVTNGSLAVILARTMGLEGRLTPSQQIYEETREHIQNIWEIQYRQDGYRKDLADLLEDKRFFPNGRPENPFGYKYVDRDRDYIVDPLAVLPDRRELHPTIKYIYTLKKRGIALEGPPSKTLTLGAVKAALRSPVFRSAPLHVVVHTYKEAEGEAEQFVTPITPGGP